MNSPGLSCDGGVSTATPMVEECFGGVFAGVAAGARPSRAQQAIEASKRRLGMVVANWFTGGGRSATTDL
jgi:hypothetical protein